MSNVSLHKLIALLSQSKTLAESVLTNFNRTNVNKKSLYFGQNRNYRPRDEDGVQYPPENVVIQGDVKAELKSTLGVYGKGLDAQINVDRGNQLANADIVFKGSVIASSVPATSLVFLEKKLKDIITVIQGLPSNPTDKKWTFNSNTGVYEAEGETTTKSAKVPTNHQKAPATTEHAAQVEIVMIDTVVGNWFTVPISKALSPAQIAEYEKNARELLLAVVQAREEANTQSVPTEEISTVLFSNIFTDITL